LNEQSLFKEIPAGISDEVPNYILSSKKYKNILVFADLHVPFHNSDALKLALKYGKKNKIDALVIAGDFVDAYSISRFIKDKTKTNLQSEFDKTKQILKVIRKEFPNIKIIYKFGNHEIRQQKYIWEHSELNLKCLELENILELKELNIECIGESRLIEYGKFIIAHGSEIQASGLTPARNVLLKCFNSIIFFHLHRTDSFKIRNKFGEILESYSGGCLCNLQQEYWMHNNWNHGFLHILNNKVKNIRIEKGKII
jgi:predicted phosphodiesterase